MQANYFYLKNLLCMFLTFGVGDNNEEDISNNTDWIE